MQIVCEDQGPGISDLAQILQVDEVTGKLSHMGLAGAKRLMDELEIESQVGWGTTVKMRRWLS